jgi:hypothetical protein
LEYDTPTNTVVLQQSYQCINKYFRIDS